MVDGDISAGDDPTDFVFDFEKENKKFQISKHFVQLSGMLRDYMESMPATSDNHLPINNFPASAHENLIKLLKISKEKDPEAYRTALTLVPVDEIIPDEIEDFIDSLDAKDCLNTANYTAYLSMEFAKRYFLDAFIRKNRKTPSSQIRILTAAYGATPLDQDDFESNHLTDDYSILEAYPDIYKDAFGQYPPRSNA